eukprot:scaffold10537_cov122-Isochrysis_galbana.AAC.24
MTSSMSKKEPTPPVNVSLRPREMSQRLSRSTRCRNAGNRSAALRASAELRNPSRVSRQMSTARPLTQSRKPSAMPTRAVAAPPPAPPFARVRSRARPDQCQSSGDKCPSRMSQTGAPQPMQRKEDPQQAHARARSHPRALRAQRVSDGRLQKSRSSPHANQRVAVGRTTTGHGLEVPTAGAVFRKKRDKFQRGLVCHGRRVDKTQK